MAAAIKLSGNGFWVMKRGNRNSPAPTIPKRIPARPAAKPDRTIIEEMTEAFFEEAS
jgi:hypothetical protein